METQLSLHQRVPFRIEVCRRHNDSQRNGFARVAFSIVCDQFRHHLIAGLEFMIQQVPLPGGRQMSTVVFNSFCGLSLQRQRDPVAAIHRNMLLHSHQRKVVFGHGFQRHDVIGRQQ